MPSRRRARAVDQLCATPCRFVRGSAWGCVPNLGRVARAWGIRVMGPLTHNVTATRPRFCIPLDEEPAITGRTADMSLPLWQSRVTHSECIPRVARGRTGGPTGTGPVPQGRGPKGPPVHPLRLPHSIKHRSSGRVPWRTRRASSADFRRNTARIRGVGAQGVRPGMRLVTVVGFHRSLDLAHRGHVAPEFAGHRRRFHDTRARSR